MYTKYISLCNCKVIPHFSDDELGGKKNPYFEVTVYDYEGC
jgi:hypothetical protein